MFFLQLLNASTVGVPVIASASQIPLDLFGKLSYYDSADFPLIFFSGGSLSIGNPVLIPHLASL